MKLSKLFGVAAVAASATGCAFEHGGGRTTVSLLPPVIEAPTVYVEPAPVYYYHPRPVYFVPSYHHHHYRHHR